ncbi:FxDxF family PEP-CTERM protein [Nitrosomonas sp.]|uniref:FxDxF family PEP-CTERM protein n=1 Tax=Nitrosomonas sp. TaxID=42353 RepID=UPI0025E4EF6C|nr:FxDxF family PEP-CTERM protein [Nitrosomonas sp.]
MFKRALITAAILTATASSAFATTAIGGATLIDTATVNSGTVSPTAYLSYSSGGNGTTGWADGSTYGITGISAASAMATADHNWLQYDPTIVVYSATALSSVLAIPAIDHGWAADNTGDEPWEAFEFRIFGSDSTGALLEEGRITNVWAKGVDDSSALKNADDWTSQWSFTGAYNYFAVVSGDRLVGGFYSPGEGEIDAIAAIPEPETYAMLLAGLGLLGFAAQRRKLQETA